MGAVPLTQAVGSADRDGDAAGQHDDDEPHERRGPVGVGGPARLYDGLRGRERRGLRRQRGQRGTGGLHRGVAAVRGDQHAAALHPAGHVRDPRREQEGAAEVDAGAAERRRDTDPGGVRSDFDQLTGRPPAVGAHHREPSSRRSPALGQATEERLLAGQRELDELHLPRPAALQRRCEHVAERGAVGDDGPQRHRLPVRRPPRRPRAAPCPRAPPRRRRRSRRRAPGRRPRGCGRPTPACGR